jgi:hypothetical protein
VQLVLIQFPFLTLQKGLALTVPNPAKIVAGRWIVLWFVVPLAVLKEIQLISVPLRNSSLFEGGRYFNAASILAVPIGREAGSEANSDYRNEPEQVTNGEAEHCEPPCGYAAVATSRNSRSNVQGLSVIPAATAGVVSKVR